MIARQVVIAEVTRGTLTPSADMVQPMEGVAPELVPAVVTGKITLRRGRALTAAHLTTE